MTEKERMKLLTKIVDLSKSAAVPENQMNSMRTENGYVLTISNLTASDEVACSKFLERLQADGVTVQESHPVSIRTIHVTHSN